MTSSPTAKERAQSAASTAGDEGRHLAGVTQQEAGNVASEAADQARRVMDDAMAQVSSQSKEQKDRLAGTLRSLGDDLQSMTSQASPGLAADLTRQVSGYARTLGDHLQSREPGELLEDVRQFARRRPGTFLLGALAAGVVVGRLVRGTADGIAGAKYVEETSGGTGYTGATGGTGTTGATPGGSQTYATTPEATYPGAPSGTPYVPDPRDTPDTHGQETIAPTAPPTSGGYDDASGLR
jgi:polyhydroxyalkanoate synthesis regulator phasin